MLPINQSNLTGNNHVSFLFLLFHHSSEVDMCQTCLKFTFRPCEFSQAHGHSIEQDYRHKDMLDCSQFLCADYMCPKLLRQ